MRHLIKNNHGQTVIENLLAMALLVLVFYMIVDGSVQLFKTDSKTVRTSSEYQVVSQLIETIKGEPAVYQKNFNINAGNSQSFLASFPYGYSGTIMYMGNAGNPPKCDPTNPAATATLNGTDLPTDSFCDGLITYTILPSQSLSGMFEGTIRVVHLKKDPKDLDLQDNYYYFLINTN
ncbi:MAG: hypothetical protein JSU04_00730 [Bdellovibrionales bacterium]|nr:hypothetical protein [Bdellovibrionales bacterium]